MIKIGEEKTVELEIKEILKGLTKEQAIDYLEEKIFYEQMADYMDFKLVAIYKKLLKQVKNGGIVNA